MKKNHFLHTSFLVLAICLAMAFSMTAMAVNARWESTTTRDGDNNICISFSDVQVVLPSSWGGNVQMNISDDSVSFYHIDSREKLTEELGYDNGGHLFTICFTQTTDYTDFPDYMVIGTVSGGTYYAWFPTDVQGYMDDAEIYSEYVSLYDDIDWVKANMTLTIETIISVDSEYIFSQSSTSYLSESDLAGMTADEVQMAINEIYARHHRKFVLEDVQAYFNSKSWYSGTIEADAFDVSVMNIYESANINLMVNYLDTHDFSSNSSSSEYIFPQSASGYLTNSDIAGMTADELQMAINEIYARHGRRFNTQSIQDYFNSKSWYSGTVSPEAFDTSVLNVYETSNINFLVSAIDALS
ncbi:MAG: YARHG domain-containing protein [Lachnospiraceae bacterium]|nr:YARHG domain-containing protein [Lachnospiraceae bacterium]